MDLLPEWVKDGASPVRRMLMRMRDGKSIATDEIQTVRIILCIRSILKREPLHCHPKMRANDVVELVQLQTDIASLLNKRLPTQAAIDSSLPIIPEKRMKRRFLGALNALSRLSFECIAPYSSMIAESYGI